MAYKYLLLPLRPFLSGDPDKQCAVRTSLFVSARRSSRTYSRIKMHLGLPPCPCNQPKQNSAFRIRIQAQRLWSVRNTHMESPIYILVQITHRHQVRFLLLYCVTKIWSSLVPRLRLGGLGTSDPKPSASWASQIYSYRGTCEYLSSPYASSLTHVPHSISKYLILLSVVSFFVLSSSFLSPVLTTKLIRDNTHTRV